MMQCEYCGRLNSDELKLCGGCGLDRLVPVRESVAKQQEARSNDYGATGSLPSTGPLPPLVDRILDSCAYCGKANPDKNHLCAGCGQPLVERVEVVLKGSPAARSSRLLGRVVDILFNMAGGIPGLLFISLLPPDQHGAAHLLVVLGTVLCMVFQWYLITTTGQSIGKKVAGTRIVLESDGSKPGFFRGVLLRTIIPDVVGFVPVFGVLVALVDTLFIFGEKRKCLHDFLAGSRVVVA